MTYDLFIGDRSFSSWSLRGWLMLRQFGLPFKTHMVGLYAGTMAEELRDMAPARTVPVLRDADGIVVTDSLAMAETLAERHPEAGLWPKDPAARALARSITSEMHSSFGALRGDCAMQLLWQWQGFEPSEGVLKDLSRIETLWTLARERHGANGPWLFGTYSLADVFYAPVCARIAGYGLPVGDLAQAYVDTTLNEEAFRQWRAMGLTVSYDPMPYQMPLSHTGWPGPEIIAAEAVDDGPSINETCPYSGKPVTHFLTSGGKVYGFCNAFCRDKTVADPGAWPAFMDIYQS